MSSRSSTPTEVQPLPDYVAVGRLGRAHGIGGEVWVEILSDVEERFDVGQVLSLRRDDHGRRSLEIMTSRPHKGGMLVGFAEVRDRNDAESLRGGWLEILREQVPAAPEDEFYHFELIGCRCVETSGRELGEVVEVVRGSGGEILEIAAGDRRLTVPFVGAFVREIFLDERRIELELPPGFLEICGSGW
jgi:16S rRNA processing protein RimM